MQELPALPDSWSTKCYRIDKQITKAKQFISIVQNPLLKKTRLIVIDTVDWIIKGE